MRVIDLTHTFANGMPVFPGLPEPAFEPIANVDTHVDAPAHQIAGGDTLDEIGLERLVTDALKIDVSHRDPHGAIPLAELEPRLDEVREGDIVLL